MWSRLTGWGASSKTTLENGSVSTSHAQVGQPVPRLFQPLQGRGKGLHVAQVATPTEPATIPSKPQKREGGLPDTVLTAEACRAAFPDACCHEQVEQLEVPVEGSLPAWLEGSYIRNGPGAYKGLAHWFDGYAMLAKFSFRGGKAYVSHRYVETDAWRGFKSNGEKPAFSEFATSVALGKDMFNVAAAAFGYGPGLTDNSSVNVLQTGRGHELTTLTESVPGTYLVDGDSLATKARIMFDDKIKGDLTTAHPCVTADGDLINIVTNLLGGPHTLVWQRLGSSTRHKIAEVKPRHSFRPSWIHDFPATKHYAVIPETPVYFNAKAFLGGNLTEYLRFDWAPEEGTLLHVIPLNGSGPVRTFQAPTYFTFHYVNAFETEDGKSLCMDFSWYDDPSFLNNMLLEEMRQSRKGIVNAPLRRLTIPLDGGSTVTMQRLVSDESTAFFLDLPRVNPKVKGLPYRYAYGLAAVRPTTIGNALAKHDVETGEVKMWREPGTFPGEPLMVPAPGAASEDEGVVLCQVAGANGRTFLLVLDAGSFEEVARVQVPYGIPAGFHATFMWEGSP